MKSADWVLFFFIIDRLKPNTVPFWLWITFVVLAVLDFSLGVIKSISEK